MSNDDRCWNLYISIIQSKGDCNILDLNWEGLALLSFYRLASGVKYFGIW